MAVMEHLLRRCNDAPMRREDGPHEHKSKQQDEDDDKCEDDKYEDDTYDNVDDVEGEEDDVDDVEEEGDEGDEDGCKERWRLRNRMECIDTWRS